MAERKRVWVVENFWGGYPYFPELTSTLKRMKLRVSELSMKTEYSAPVLVLLVEERAP